eukprot:scaffold97208_cov45-Phaeocystis_antarctica.AAC.1
MPVAGVTPGPKKGDARSKNGGERPTHGSEPARLLPGATGVPPGAPADGGGVLPRELRSKKGGKKPPPAGRPPPPAGIWRPKQNSPPPPPPPPGGRLAGVEGVEGVAGVAGAAAAGVAAASAAVASVAVASAAVASAAAAAKTSSGSSVGELRRPALPAYSREPSSSSGDTSASALCAAARLPPLRLAW